MRYTRDELIEASKMADSVEIYQYSDFTHRIHSDFIQSDGELEYIYQLPSEVDCDYELMDEERYNNTILANCGLAVNFETWYGNKNAEILVIVLSHEYKIINGELYKYFDSKLVKEQ